MYNKDILTQINQGGSLLRSKFMFQSMKGEVEYFNTLKNFQVHEVTDRFGDINYDDVDHRKRRVKATPYRSAQLISQYDERRVLIDLKGSYLEEAVTELGIKIDKVLIDALVGDAIEEAYGEVETTKTLTLNVSKDLGTSDSSLTPTKIRRAHRLLSKRAGQSKEKKFIICDAHSLEDLLSNEQIASRDYFGDVLKDGTVGYYNGFHFIVVGDGLLTGDGTSGSPRKVIACTEKSLRVGIWKDINTQFERVVTKDCWQLLSQLEMGAVRMDEDRVATIDTVLSS
jgi:hypothetical protein